MSTTPKELWNPETFDALRRQLIPSFDLLYNSGAAAVAASVPARARILDLGAGTGLLSSRVAALLPEAELLLVDRSVGMLSKAEARFAAQTRISSQVGDLLDPLPAGPFDAVVSGLAIHHLEHDDKRMLFKRIYEVLAPGGLFVNVEQLLAPDPKLEPMYDRQHEDHVLRMQTPAEEWAAGRERMKYDICAPLPDQLDWLTEAGFARVDCLSKDWRFATYAGWVAG